MYIVKIKCKATVTIVHLMRRNCTVKSKIQIGLDIQTGELSTSGAEMSYKADIPVPSNKRNFGESPNQ